VVPLLIAVDDAHWLDTASLDALVFTARRLEADQAGFVFVVREGEGAFPAAGLEKLVVDGVDVDGARSLLASAAEGRVASEVAQQLHTLTRGNPLALVELARELSPAQLAGTAPLEEPLYVGTRAKARHGDGGRGRR
jgi:hypothetical protein